MELKDGKAINDDESSSSSSGSSDGSESEKSQSDENDKEEHDDDEVQGKGIKQSAKRKAFGDDNDKWLKRKVVKQKKDLLSSDDDDESEEDDDDEMMNDEFDEDAEDEEELEIERKSKRIDEEKALEEEDAAEDLRHTIATHTSIYHLPTEEELKVDADRVVPTSELRRRVEDILEVLADFKKRREPGRNRTEYIQRLILDIAELHGYIPELVELFVDHFGPTEALEFIVESDKSRPLVIRTNTLKTRRKDLAAALLKRGVNLDPLASWSKVGLKIYDSAIPIGATPEYLAGHYMLQAASSMCPVLALSPAPKERVLDMAAAPGGKTSYIAQLMNNTGIVIANDLRPDRQKATTGNLHRLGVTNSIVCHHDGRKLGNKMKNFFDKVLLDSPCSGLGVISRDPSVKVQRTLKDVLQTVVLQKQLVLSAVDALKDGGTFVYSTCSVCIHENEEVVNYLLTRRDVKIVDAGLDFGKPGFTRYKHKRFHPSLELTRRFYPHVHNMDGFYVAKLKKISSKVVGHDEGIAAPQELASETVAESKKRTEDQIKPSKNANKSKAARHESKNEVAAKGEDTNKNSPSKDGKGKKLSQPPKHDVAKPKKKSTSKKMTLPRRKKT